MFHSHVIETSRDIVYRGYFLLPILFFKFFIEVQLNYNVVLITALHQSDSLMHICTFLISIHFCWIFNCLRGHFMNHGILLRLPCCKKGQLHQSIFCKLLKRTFSTHRSYTFCRTDKLLIWNDINGFYLFPKSCQSTK